MKGVKRGEVGRREKGERRKEKGEGRRERASLCTFFPKTPFYPSNTRGNYVHFDFLDFCCIFSRKPLIHKSIMCIF